MNKHNKYVIIIINNNKLIKGDLNAHIGPEGDITEPYKFI
jgi:hypothetical protein